MIIPIERESLESLLRTLCRAENAMIYPDAIGGIQAGIQELTAILQANPEPERGRCLICGAETDAATSAVDINYCGQCWNGGNGR